MFSESNIFCAKSSSNANYFDHFVEDTTAFSTSEYDQVDVHQPQEDTTPIIQNIVATAYLGKDLDLNSIHKRLRFVEYNPKKFSALIVKLREPRASASIFSNGKVVVSGTKSVDDALIAARRFARMVQKLDPEVTFGKFAIQNMVANGDLKFRVKLREFHNAFPNECKYDPEIFPGLTFKNSSPKLSVLISSSGKVVLTGGKNKEDIDFVFQSLQNKLENFKF
jgi:transcription initiation factor TFIID TATA-box-binding protein